MDFIPTKDWYYTRAGDPRGYIQPHALQELWFHTGTACNLACPFCLEGSKPGDTRLDRITLEDAQPYIDEALTLGVEQFSFTGGEPFVVRDMVRILRYAATHRPCLVLTNGTEPVLRRLTQIAELRNCAHPVSFRVSIDWPDQSQHDAGRGEGSFQNAWEGMRALHALGFKVSLARQMRKDEDRDSVDAAYQALFAEWGLPVDTHIVAFPDFQVPHSEVDVPEITEDCMTRYQTEAQRRAYMCAYSKMLVKEQGEMKVFACTLVDDDARYGVRGSLRDAMAQRVLLRHHRCFSCFSMGASCSEL